MENLVWYFKEFFVKLFGICYCERCGKAIWRSEITRCPRCDFRIRNADEKCWGLFALGLIPVIGLISGIIASIVCAKRGKKRKAKSAISGALLGLLLLVIAAVLALLAFGII